MTSVQEGVSALAVAQRWSEWSQLHDGDRDDLRTVESLTISLKQNKTQELVEIWKVGIRLRRACSISNLESPAYCCFSINGNDMTPMVEEYAMLLMLRGVDPESCKEYREEESMDQKGNNTYLDTTAAGREVGAIF
ncbi:hypothetical protein V6N12_050874 [Hibiscus sabdariffa]|uniref:Uncharacterized protein n=1 Tax=Hibiscus sabdariffa TaxID=183260 RepID=A0ABR2GDS5_9ROSI